MGSSAWLIVGGVCALIVVGVVVGVVNSIVKSVKRSAKRAVRKATNAAGTVGTLIALGKVLSEIDPNELNAEPGPKSISGVTKLVLPQISRDFPTFEYNEAKSRAENVLLTYLSAISQQEASLLSEGTPELKKELESIIYNLQCAGQDENYDRIHIHQTEIGSYKKNAGRCIITFQMSVEYYKYTVNSSGAVISGSRDKKVQTRYDVDMIYIQDREVVGATLSDAKGLNCPNCGAPLKMLGSKSCAYCGAAVEEYNIHVWNFSNVEEKVRV